MNNNILNLNKKITVVVLAYNEAKIIENVVENFYEKVIKRIPDIEFIISEDGSIDGTKEILERLNKEIPYILFSERTRKGYAKALKDALRKAKTELIFFSDGDGQHNPIDFFKLLNYIDENDIVSGYRYSRCDPIYRTIISKVYNFLIYLLFGLKMKDIDSGFKLIKKKVIDNVLNDMYFKYCAMSELILRAYLIGYRIKEVPINHYPRKFGKSVIFNPEKFLIIIISLIKDLFQIRFSYIMNKNK